MHLLDFLITTILITAIKAEVDCSKHPPHVNFTSCCELSNLISQELKEKCMEQDLNNENFGPPGPPRHSHGPPGGRGGPREFGPHKHCFLSCVVTETGILVDGELQENELMSYLEELFGDDEKIAFLSSEFMSCYEKQKDLESKWPEHNKHGAQHCQSKENGMLMGCVHIHAFKHCPDSFWSNTDECNEAREHFSQCRPPCKDHGAVEEQEAEEI